MRKNAGFLITLAIGTAVFMLTQAGDTEPPGPPSPTMVTLQQIHDKLGECGIGGRCRVQKTGQTGCWDALGDPIDCAGTGQDGEYQAGLSLEQRFTDNGDGTVTDNLTSLIWLQDTNCFGSPNWASAVSDANNLADGACGLSDGSVPGDWRLPNVRELVSVIDFVDWLAAPPPGNPFTVVETFPGYWSSTSSAAFTELVWVMIPGGGQLNLKPKIDPHYVWPVRGGL